MLQELHREEFGLANPLLRGERVNLEIKGIAAGNNPGWIFVDDRHNPQTALVFSHGQKGFYFVGKEYNSSFLSKVRNTIVDLRPRLAVLGVEDFEYSGTSAEWDRVLRETFTTTGTIETQHVYLRSNLKDSPLPLVGSESPVEEITAELMNRADLDTGFAKRIILEWWESLADFYAQGAGYCVIRDGRIVSLCYTSFVAPGEWELGVDTHKDYRQRGLARLTAAAMLHRCQEQGVSPYWDCMETNTPSRKLAEGLGLTLAFTYPVFWFPLK